MARKLRDQSARVLSMDSFERIESTCYNKIVPDIMIAHAITCLDVPDSPLWLAFLQAIRSGQVAQLVERSPEKAGVGGSIPSLATIKSRTYPIVFSSFGCTWLQ